MGANRARGQAVVGAVDQAALAAANFLLGVCVARLGGVVPLGEFAFAYSLIVLVSMMHTAIIAELYSVDSDVDEGMRRYGAFPIATVTLLLAASVIGLFGLIGSFAESIRAVAWTPSFISALLFSACYWSVKPLFYRQRRPYVVLGSTVFYGVAVLASAWLGYRWKGVTWDPLWSVAIGGVIASIPMWCALKLPGAGYADYVRKYLRSTGRYAGWALPAAVLIWINSNGYIFVMPLYGNAAETGGLRAILNLIAPVNTLLVGACMAWLPMLADMHRKQNALAYGRMIHRIAMGLFLLTIVVSLPVIPLSSWLIGLIYGAAYAGFAEVLRIAAWLPALWIAASIYRAAIRAQANARDLCKVYAVAMVPVGIVLMLTLGRYGAAAAVKGMLITQALVVGAFMYYFQRQLRQGGVPA